MTDLLDVLNKTRFTGVVGKWKDFRLDFRGRLARDGLAIFLEGPELPPDASQARQTAWKESNAKVFGIIVGLTSGDVRSVIQPYEEELDGRGAWRAMVEKYENKGKANRSAVQRQLFARQLEAAEDPTIYFGEIEDLRRQLRAMDMDVTDSQMVCLVLGNLPSEYAIIQAHMDAEVDMSYDAMKERIYTFFLRRAHDEHLHDKNLVLAARAQGGAADASARGGEADSIVCKICGGRGHRQAICPSKGGGAYKRGKGPQCWRCKQWGHIAEDCEEQKKKAFNVAL